MQNHKISAEVTIQRNGIQVFPKTKKRVLVKREVVLMISDGKGSARKIPRIHVFDIDASGEGKPLATIMLNQVYSIIKAVIHKGMATIEVRTKSNEVS